MKDIKGQAPSQNIAVSGAYGSGKSSVLEGLLAELKTESILAIQVSLATLNQSRQALLQVSGEPTLTSALEKEVVKRLLYSVKPADIPRSRFHRIGGFRLWPAVGLAAVISAFVVGAAKTFDVQLPADRIAAAQEWWGWLAPVLDFLSVGVLVFFAQAALSSFRLSQIAVGPATLSLDDKDGNYFDHYLDEIIYFFERTKIRVVLFEDLDRFNDPGIYLALRELNNLLNSSQQIKTENRVTFVYAIRDSLFVETLGSGTREADADAELPDAHARHGADSAASDRAKFFDLIVPVVPFISHEVAADLLLSTLSDLPDQWMPSQRLVGLVGRHFTDMRVILSIRNEFEVFANELLANSAVRGLLADQLFAMVVYKHVHLDDFERIRTGESRLDAAVDRIRSTAADLVSMSDTAIAETENAIETDQGIDRRAKTVGDRLLGHLDVSIRIAGQGPAQTFIVGEKTFERAEVPTKDFWTAMAETGSPALRVITPNRAFNVPADDVVTLLGDSQNLATWTRSEVELDRQRLTVLKKARAWLLTASFAELLAGPFPPATLRPDHTWSEVADACAEAIGEGLPYELIRTGYLDQNFALYTTKFYGAILSAAARSYLMQYVDRHRNEPLFTLSPEDVDQILELRGDALLDDASALNVAIVDRLLEMGASRIPVLLETAGQATDFLLTYLANGHYGEELLRRIASERSDILDVIAAASSLSEADRRNALSTCLSSLAGDVDYAVAQTTADVLARGLDEMAVLQTEVDPHTAAAIASLLGANSLNIRDLSRVVEPLRGVVASAGCFLISRANLEAISPGMDGIGLDTLDGLEDGVGRHLIANMPDYLAALREPPSASIVDEPKNLDEVVRAIVDTEPTYLLPALEALPPGLVYDDLTAAPETAYPDLASAAAFAVTIPNVDRYWEIVGQIDEALAGLLTKVKTITVTEDEADKDDSRRLEFASILVRSGLLDADTIVSLVTSLRTRHTLNVPALHLGDPDLAAKLLAAREIADNLETFLALAEGPWPVLEACAAQSSHFESYATDLPFNDELLANMLGSVIISDNVKRALLAQFAALQPVIAAASAVAWMTATSHLHIPLAAAEVTALARAGARSDQLIEATERGHERMSATDLVTVLAHCEEPYSGLASANGAKLTVPYSDDFRPVLKRLEEGGLVRSFRKKSKRDQFEVQMAG